MSYLIIVVIGAVAGWIGGQMLKGSELGLWPDVAAGAVGAIVAVVISRLFGPQAAAGFLISFIVSIIGAFGALYGMRHVMKEKPLPVSRQRRR
ncbi:MAG TPA: GlsB/YeaQ/YmgE family stress response membrane protein [Thermoanaerobaculia bacterium]|nr:GlsB/YeaQ/YmgE family stress response membrane protein [Thermoanaerobaculia bacterium]